MGAIWRPLTLFPKHRALLSACTVGKQSIWWSVSPDQVISFWSQCFLYLLPFLSSKNAAATRYPSSAPQLSFTTQPSYLLYKLLHSFSLIFSSTSCSFTPTLSRNNLDRTLYCKPNRSEMLIFKQDKHLQPEGKKAALRQGGAVTKPSERHQWMPYE